MAQRDTSLSQAALEQARIRAVAHACCSCRQHSQRHNTLIGVSTGVSVCVCGERERDRERDRKRETERERDRETERETEREIMQTKSCSRQI